jgi:hypothetical protein
VIDISATAAADRALSQPLLSTMFRGSEGIYAKGLRALVTPGPTVERTFKVTHPLAGQSRAWSSIAQQRERTLVRSNSFQGAADRPLASAPAYVAAPIPYFVAFEMVNVIEAP